MDNLTMDLVRLSQRNRDGSYGTQTNRRRGLTAMANDLDDLGYKLPSAASLKPKHIQALVEKWLDADTTDASIRNRLTWLRWWAEKINKPNVVNRDNAAYGVGERGEITRNRAQTLDPAKFKAIECPYIQASLLLQSAFGLRREEAMKFQPLTAIRGEYISLQGSWTKGGRARTVPITTLEQRQVLQHVMKLMPGRGSLIPAHLSYIEHLKRFEYQTLKVNLRNTHGLRHAYAQKRYVALSGQVCPLAGGKNWATMTQTEREADRAARRQISAELGHGRLKITDIYLGSAF
ncbi:phage integrase N-terminal domain-containing protein [Agrobacterium bohemicum]|uniref:Integrase n=1 Tax=Agrobacterium bohemicum TaxID=2052828 RepID=A0A135P854_9HYPH|nr:phage integrase N-terminal domain-containing protein [Agrobacterium bohemicum]KXG87600.1 integrase [Agrobacterium bohemicum]